MKVGLSPGTLVFIGSKKQEKSKVTCIDFGEDFFREADCQTVDEALVRDSKQSVKWVNIDGISDVSLVEKIGKEFNLHPLLLEDLLNTHQRPKLEEYGDRLFLIIKMLRPPTEKLEFHTEQIAFVIGPDFVLSFQEDIGDHFDPVRNSLRQGKGKIRKSGADYLCYALIDAIVDHYFLVPELLGEQVEELQRKILKNPSPADLHAIQSLKHQLLYLRKAVWPLREVVSRLSRDDVSMVQDTTRIFFRDVYDHTIQVIETIETLREMLTGLLDIYLTSVSNKMNEAMRVLAVIATIFMPLTFIAGIYGMNFEYMPELKRPYGYFELLGVMAVIVVLMVAYFRKKDWL